MSMYEEWKKNTNVSRPRSDLQIKYKSYQYKLNNKTYFYYRNSI